MLIELPIALPVSNDFGWSVSSDRLITSPWPASEASRMLHEACRQRSLGRINLLLRQRVDVDARDAEGATALCRACVAGDLAVVQLLSAYGARRGFVFGGLSAEEACAGGMHSDVLAWLKASREWSTPLHHASVLDPSIVLELLRGGADVHARRPAPELFREPLVERPAAPSPLDVAHEAPCSSGSRLVIQAAAPWSPATHHLFPAGARQRAAELLRIGGLLARRSAALKLALPDALYDPWLLIIGMDVQR